MQRVWEARQLRLINFILYVPYESLALEHSNMQMFHSPQWEVVGKDSGTFILSGETQLLLSSDSPVLGATFVHHIHQSLPDLASLARAPFLRNSLRHQSVLRQCLPCSACTILILGAPSSLPPAQCLDPSAKVLPFLGALRNPSQSCPSIFQCSFLWIASCCLISCPIHSLFCHSCIKLTCLL